MNGKFDLDKVRRALRGTSVLAGEPGELDPAVGPHGGTHDTDVEIADDVVKLVDTNSPDTPDLETRAYESGTEDDGSADTPPYDGKSSVDGIPTIPDTMAAAQDDAGDPQKNNGGGGPVVQLPDTMQEDLSVAPSDPHSSSASLLTHDDLVDLRKLMASKADEDVEKAVKVLQWMDRNTNNPKRAQAQAALDKWEPSRSQAIEAQARYAFAYLHTDAAAAEENHAETLQALSWLKSYLVGAKLKIAKAFLTSDEATKYPNVAKKIASWYKTHAVDQVTENKEDVGIEDITLYGPQNGSPDHRPDGGPGFTEPKVVSLDDVPFKDPKRHPAEAGSEVDKQSGTPAQDSNAVDSDSFSAKSDDRAKESNLPTAKTQKVKANPMMPGMGVGEELAAPPMPGVPGLPEEEEMMPPMPGAPPMPGGAPDAQPPMPELPPVLPEGDEGPAAGGMPGMPGGGGAPMAPMADEGGDLGGIGDLDLDAWLQQELMEPGHDQPAESAHVEMLSSFDKIGQVMASDVVMSLYNADQENPHWNIDIAGRPVARVELVDQPNPEQVRATFLSGNYAENIASAIARIGAEEVLTTINAKPYAAKVEVGALAEKIRARVEADMELRYAEKVGELRDRFLTAAKLALSAYNNNFYRDHDHALKAALWSEMRRLGVQDAARAIEAAFEEASVPFFEDVLAKAEEFMDMPDDARNYIAAAIPGTNSLVTANAGTGDEIPEHETLARRLEAANVPFENTAQPVTASSRSSVRDAIREKVRLSTIRTS